jgi:hypothetical protein
MYAGAQCRTVQKHACEVNTVNAVNAVKEVNITSNMDAENVEDTQRNEKNENTKPKVFGKHRTNEVTDRNGRMRAAWQRCMGTDEEDGKAQVCAYVGYECMEEMV